ncbi:MAG: hypothetical protein EKK57_09805 [Proteobacteria bacterium]|nr:MAG: hypothetical protein EKK57_09805 [Pseudomonadota bacterium]
MHTLSIFNTKVIVCDDGSIEFIFKATPEQLANYSQNKPNPEEFSTRIRKITDYLVSEGFIKPGNINAKIFIEGEK